MGKCKNGRIAISVLFNSIFNFQSCVHAPIILCSFETSWVLEVKQNDGKWDQLKQGPPEGINYGDNTRYLGKDIVYWLCIILFLPLLNARLIT